MTTPGAGSSRPRSDHRGRGDRPRRNPGSRALRSSPTTHSRCCNDRLNYLTPTKKPVGFGTDRNGRRTRLYDKPATPLDRLLAAKVLALPQEAELVAHRDSLNPAAIGREIADLQAVLLKLAKDKTEQLYLATIPSALPDVRNGIRIKAS